MILILLDRNAVSDIKYKVNGGKLLQPRSRKLRLLDRKEYVISPILSIREGQLGIRENESETKETIESETKIISRFFKRAKTDSKYLFKNRNELANIFAKNIEDKWDNYVLFLTEMNRFLYQPISKRDKNKYEEKILDSALKHNITLGNPILMGCFSILYGSDKSRKIFKFKEKDYIDKNIHNALNDLIIINRLSMIELLVKKHNSYEKVEFFTFDIGLDSFLKDITFKGQNLTEGSIETDITYDINLFPDLNEESFDKFKNRLLAKNEV